MSEDHQQQEGDQQAQEAVNPNPDQPEHTTGLTDVNDSMQVKDSDVPWDVVQAQEDLAKVTPTRATAYFMFNGNPVLVCEGGFYGKHEGNIQSLPVKVLVDNI